MALFIIGGVMALLLFLGIHNAWDATTFFVTERLPRQIERDKPGKPGKPGKPAKRDEDGERQA